VIEQEFNYAPSDAVNVILEAANQSTDTLKAERNREKHISTNLNN